MRWPKNVYANRGQRANRPDCLWNHLEGYVLSQCPCPYRFCCLPSWGVGGGEGFPMQQGREGGFVASALESALPPPARGTPRGSPPLLLTAAPCPLTSRR